MLNAVKQFVLPKVGMAELAMKRHAPEIYLGGGIAAGVVSVVMIAKAHKKSEGVFADVVEEIEALNERVWDNNELARQDAEQTGEDIVAYIDESGRRKMVAPLYIEAVKRGILLYGPGVAMGFTSLGLILTSHGILRGRNKSLVATIGVVQQGFAAYRKRVIEEQGEDADERFYYGLEARKYTEQYVDEDGKKRKRKTTRNHVPETPTPEMYQRLFDENNVNHHRDPDLSEYYIMSIQSWAQDQLALKGYIILNDVYKNLGYPETPEGAVVGWAKDVPGDGFVDFGLDEPFNEEGRRNNAFLLDFNVHGPILDVIGKNA
jgi:hypothetical protein